MCISENFLSIKNVEANLEHSLGFRAEIPLLTAKYSENASWGSKQPRHANWPVNLHTTGTPPGRDSVTGHVITAEDKIPKWMEVVPSL